MKKVLKMMMVLIMMIGISFSFFNFMSVETNAGVEMAVWQYVAGKWRCCGDGSDCVIGGHDY